MKAQIAADFRGFVRQFAPSLFKEGAASPLLQWAVSQMQKTPAHVAEACFDVALTDLRPTLKKLKVPTAVFQGRHDTPLADAEELAKLVKGAKLVTFEESAHAPHLEEPEKFNQALVKLLGE
jgi:pimeloyl-[acyl-carrier protein] methyl ester esterase